MSFLLDNSLNPAIASALRLVDYDIRSVNEVFGAQPQDSVPDEEIIAWCAANGTTWITADIAARIQHEAQLKAECVSVVWIRQPKAGLSTKQQHKAIVRYLDKVEAALAEAPDWAFHWKVGSHEKATIEQVWEKRRPKKA